MDRESFLETLARLVMAELGLLDDGTAAVLAARMIVLCCLVLTMVPLLVQSTRWHPE